MNIASIVGVVNPTGLGINDVGYTAAKHGVVALTRSFESSNSNVEASEGIKAYALCPYFADTGQCISKNINVLFTLNHTTHSSVLLLCVV